MKTADCDILVIPGLAGSEEEHWQARWAGRLATARVVEQAVRLARGDALMADDGSALRLQASTLCVHGDNDSSVAAVRQIRQALDALESQ